MTKNKLKKYVVFSSISYSKLLFYLVKYDVKLEDFIPYVSGDFLHATAFNAKVNRLKKSLVSDMEALLL